MERPERGLLSLILVPAIVSNAVTLLRLGTELAGLGDGTRPTQPSFWVSLSLLIPVAGLYFAYMLRDARRPFLRLPLVLYLYGLSVRIPTAVIYWLAGTLGWNTHYGEWAVANQSYVAAGLIPQLVGWPIITVVGGFIVGTPLLLWVRSKKAPAPAST